MAGILNSSCSLYTLKSQFFCMVLLKKFKFFNEDRKCLIETPKQQVDLLNTTVLSKTCERFPPSLSYQRAFLKVILNMCEENNFEIADELYTCYTSLIGKSVVDADHCFKTYFLSTDEYISIEESTQIISNGTTGLCTWQAAKYLAEWAIDNKAIFKNKHVLELGCGLGLTGIVVCKYCCPATYTFSDCHDHVLQAVEKNAKINSIGRSYDEKVIPDSKSCDRNIEGSRQVKTFFKKLDWEEFNGMEINSLQSDFILAADVVYDSSLLRPLANVLLSLLSSSTVSSPNAYISSTIRNEETFSKFIDILDKSSITWEDISSKPRSIFHYDNSTEIKLLKLSFKKT